MPEEISRCAGRTGRRDNPSCREGFPRCAPQVDAGKLSRLVKMQACGGQEIRNADGMNKSCD
jgi:hypothetical protein